MAITIADITPRQALGRFHDELALTDRDISAAFGVSHRTILRWRQGKAYPQHDAREKIDSLLALLDELTENFDSISAMQKWMLSTNRYLGGLTPAEAVRAGRVDRARLALKAMEAGIYL